MNKRLILFMTSLALAASPMSVLANEYTGPLATIEAVEDRAMLQAATGDYKKWLQYDGRWGSMTLGAGGDTMADSGCLVTAIAMLMVHSGAADESGVDPGKLCAYLSNNGGFTGNSELYWAKINGAVSGFRLAHYNVSLSGSRYDKAAKIKRYLDEGYYVVVSVGYDAHWVAVDYADDEGNVYIFDPGYSYTSLFEGYKDPGITCMATFTSTGSGQGNIDTGDVEIEGYKATGKVDVGASYLNVRAGAGTDKGYLKDSSGNRVSLSDGEEVQITGKGKDGSGATWYRISINGLVGYVYGAYIDVQTSGSTVTGEGKPAKVTGSYVNIRSGAGTAYTPVGGASMNAVVQVYEEKNDSQGNLWYKVKYNDIVGYMSAEFVQLEEEETKVETIYSESKSGKVNATLVNLRKEIGYDKDVLAELPLNTKVTLLGETKDSEGTKWYKVKYDGKDGYMVAEYITITEDDTEAGDYTESKNGVVNADYVYVRTGAGTEHSKKTSLMTNTTVTVVGEAKDSNGTVWYKIKYAGGEGYMRYDFIDIKEDTDKEDDTDSNNNSGNYAEKPGKVNANLVNVRKAPGTSNHAVGNLSKGAAVTVIGEGKDSSGTVWYKIKYSGGEGYMRYDFITIDGSGSGSSNNNNSNSSTTTQKYGKVNANSVNVRKGAGTNNDAITSLNTGAAVTINGTAKDSAGATWYKVTFSGGEGYIHSSYVTITEGPSSDSSSSTTPSYTQKNGTVNGDYVYVRTGPGTENSKKTSLMKGTAVTITDEAKDSAGAVWYKITYSGGSGYMHSDYITIGTGSSSNESGSSSAGSDSSSGNNTGSSSSGSSSVNVPTEGVAGKEGVVNQPLVRVRKSASANADVVVELEQDVSVFIESATKDDSGIVWYKVSYAGETGYMMGQYITVK